MQSPTYRRLFIDGEGFRIEAVGFQSDILTAGIERYCKILFGSHCSAKEVGSDAPADGRPFIKALKIDVTSNDQSLNLETVENYTLSVNGPKSTLRAATVFGALHGLETFSQLLEDVDVDDMLLQGNLDAAGQLLAEGDEPSDDDEPEEGESPIGKHKHKHRKKKKKHHHHRKRKAAYSILETYMYDMPRFKHRGLLLDTARHYLPVPVILDHLDAMAWSKLNVLHWHIVDDQSFPFVSKSLPLLSEKGAFDPDLVYTPEDVRTIVDYAKNRGIRVIPEFDTPGHTLSWGTGYPHILTDCYDEKGRRLGRKGPMNPAANATYEFLWTLLQEVASVFPDGYIHLGGDEVPFDCWLNNPDVKAWTAAQVPEIRSMPALEEYFERRVLDLAAAAGRSYIVWQEILDNNLQVQDDTVVHVWKWWPAADEPLPTNSEDRMTLGGSLVRLASRIWSSVQKPLGMKGASNTLHRRQPLSGQAVERSDRGRHDDEKSAWIHELEKVTARGYRALLSSPWYLNLGGFASNDWAHYYGVEPLDFDARPEQKELVIGGEACVWGEFVDATNSIQRTWPRAAAVAERLWSAADVRDRDDALQRLTAHRCRMRRRGVDAEPLGPGFCDAD